ncbi:hypothetical protein A1O3_09109 [Capronia epimyces CBS 606.96]|uniref:Uncharacterized protein n=1 Tax=Capronia epimyces CBS 606.96 TaxID=1182542 RepID=W9XKV7_9EURO|nr:uncharacterized protein A1O3_09109 [Capronia epimyces CBS 606.96]EXJ77950.1 hypothetical protein A1O3_09109 [Capronia epimyces CBS 606.96]
MTETSPTQDPLEFQDTPEYMHASSFFPESGLQESARSAQAIDRGNGPWKLGPQYGGPALVEDDVFSASSFFRDVTPGALNPWAPAASYDTTSFASPYDLFNTPVAWNG